MECRKRKKQFSHSSERENKSRRTQLHHRTYDGHYLETRNLNHRLDSWERPTRDPSFGMACEEDSREGTCRDRERDWHHYSKSSGRSGRSGRSRRSSHRHRDRGRRRSPSRPRSSTVRENPSPRFSPLLSFSPKSDGPSQVLSQCLTPFSLSLCVSNS